MAKSNQLQEEDAAFHGWYRFVLSYPAHLVRKYLVDFALDKTTIVLDPFAGTGTTLVEAKLAGIPSVGIEANPFAHFASSVKTNWDVDVDDFFLCALEVAETAQKTIKQKHKKLLSFGEEQNSLLINNSISPLILHKTLILKQKISALEKKPFYGHLLLALAKSTTFSASNLRFGPEVGLGKIKEDADVTAAWLTETRKMARDLKGSISSVQSMSIYADARSVENFVKPKSIQAVITSPPYPNEKDYSRITRLESVLLDFVTTREDLRTIKKSLVRSNTRGVYKSDNDAAWAEIAPEVEQIASSIEERRIELQKTSGFERLYPKVTREYFGGMARHLKSLTTVLRPGAKLAYVVGDQASYLRVMIRTGTLIAQIAEALGYQTEKIDLFRERFASSTKAYLREEVVVLSWRAK